MREQPEAADRPELRRPLRQPGRAGHRPRDPHGPAGRFDAGRALPGHQPVADGGRAATTWRGAATPRTPADLAEHDCLIYSTVQGDDRWLFSGADGQPRPMPVRGPLRSNNLSARAGGGARRPGPGGAAVVRGPRVGRTAARCSRCCATTALPSQEIHAVFPSPQAGAVEGHQLHRLAAVADRRTLVGEPAGRCPRAARLTTSAPYTAPLYSPRAG